jgi:prepilin-type N-terminal cleavage/methylation domain-containing protein
MNMRRNKKGFTLIELMVAMAISTVVMGAIYSVYTAQTKSARTQQMIVEMHQNIRAAMFLLEKDIRMAGFDISDPPAGARIEQDFINRFTALPTTDADPGEPENDDDPKTDATHIAFTADEDEDGHIDFDKNEDDNINRELIAYRFANGELQVWQQNPDEPDDWTWLTAAENISGVSFVYLDQNEAVTADLSLVRAIDITIAAATSTGERTMSMTNRVKCRNLSF